MPPSPSSPPSKPSLVPPSPPEGLPPEGPPHIEISPHILTFWFGMMAVGGVGFGFIAPQRPFGKGLLAEPWVFFVAAVAVVLLTLRFLYAKRITEFINIRALTFGIAIGIASYALGYWFGISLTRMP